MALQHFQSVQNESYGVLGGGVPQSIELKDNAAYSTVQTQSAPHSQSIAVNDNVAYRTTTEKADQSYDYIYYFGMLLQNDCVFSLTLEL